MQEHTISILMACPLVEIVEPQAEQIHSIREWANVRAVAATPKEDPTEYKSELEIIKKSCSS